MTVGAEEFKIYLYDEFINYKSGIPIGWTSNPTAISPVIGYGNKGEAVRLLSTDMLYDGNMQQMFTPPIDGKVVIEAKVYMPDVVYRRALFTMKDNSSQEHQTLLFNSNGYITVAPGDIKVMMYQAKQWYHLQLVFDSDKDVIDLYVDGDKKLDNHYIGKDMTNLSLLRFGQWDRSNAYFYIDDIFVYTANDVLPVQTLEEIMRIEFTDLENHWAESAVNYLADIRLVRKSEDKLFYPDSIATKKDLVEMLSALIKTTGEMYVNTFVDIKQSDDFSSYVQFFINKGIMFAGKEFEPDKELTLEEAITVAVETYKYVKQEVPGAAEKKFVSTQVFGEWARDYLGQGKHLGLFKDVKGIKADELYFEVKITRAQLIVILKNLYAAII